MLFFVKFSHNSRVKFSYVKFIYYIYNDIIFLN